MIGGYWTTRCKNTKLFLKNMNAFVLAENCPSGELSGGHLSSTQMFVLNCFKVPVVLHPVFQYIILLFVIMRYFGDYEFKVWCMSHILHVYNGENCNYPF